MIPVKLVAQTMVSQPARSETWGTQSLGDGRGLHAGRDRVGADGSGADGVGSAGDSRLHRKGDGSLRMWMRRRRG